MPTSRSTDPIGSPSPPRRPDNHHGHLGARPGRGQVVVRVAVHQASPDGLSGTGWTHSPDLSSTNSTQDHCVDVEHQPTDLAVSRTCWPVPHIGVPFRSDMAAGWWT